MLILRRRKTAGACGDHQRGATLVEILVAVVVLAIGLLGLAGLQMAGLKSNHSAYLRSQATMLAYDLADRMRAQRDDALNGMFDDDDDPTDERAAWDNLVTALLGANATGTLVRNDRDLIITITWDDERGSIRSAGGNVPDPNVSFVYRTEL